MALFATLTLASTAPLRAQDEVRFVLVVTGGIPPYLRGELRLSRNGADWRGTLAMEDRDSLLPVTGIAFPADSVLFETPLLGGMHFRGRRQQENVAGEAVAADGVVRSWTANRLSRSQEYYPSLPRFTLRQIVVAGVRTSSALPPALQALLRPGEEVDSLYRARSTAAGWRALSGAALAADRGPRALGLFDRSASRAVQQGALVAIESGIADPAVRRRFVGLFHPAGNWIVDIHDAALRFAQLAQPGFRLESIAPALEVLGDGAHDSLTAEQIVAAVYRLVQLRETDSAAFALMLQDSATGPAATRRALVTLVDAYRPAFEWHAAALRFLLTERWLPAGLPAPTIAAMVAALPFPGGDTIPQLRARLIGYAQAYPHIRPPDRWVDSLVQPENPNAGAWRNRHGRSELLQVLHRLVPAFDTGTVVAESGNEYRLTTIGQQGVERETGFLEPRDVILIEPALPPLLAVQTVVHEWIHIRHEHAREAAGLAWRISRGGVATYQPVTPVLAEGVAEWESERVLAPLIDRLPLLGVFEAEKRAAMLAGSPEDSHLLGFRLAAGLSARLGEAKILPLLVRYAGDLDALARDPAVGGPGARPARSATWSAPFLIPETRFSVDDTSPEVIGTRVRVPIGGGRPRQ